MPSINAMSADITVAKLKLNYGGVMPNWQEFIKAAEKQNIKVDKTVAANAFAIPINGISKKLTNFVGLLLWLSFLLAPVTLFAWVFNDISAWWIVISFVASRFLINAIRKYTCIFLIKLAIKNESCYIHLVNCGAFIFKP